uniref:Isoform 2 of Interferon regulatory factor 3 n=1 Tax=Mus musculus TaxID=10090 RepID=P70671-2|nr:interferon regulatory factor 3 transcript variant a [Mus musculus]
METPKPRILPWLVSQLDLGQLEGVAWLDESRTRFRIPWKHGLRQDAQMADFGIFQAWAEASGAYTPGKDKPDVSTWKRNFRSALNRKEVLRLAADNSKDPYDPHKVYEFVTPGARDFVHLGASPDTNGKSSLPHSQENLPKLFDGLILGPLKDEGSSDLAIVSDPSQQLPSPNVNNFLNPAPQENPLKQLLAEEQWEFEVTAFYRGRQVFQQTLFCPGGLRLVGSTADMTLPWQPVTLPDPEGFLTDKLVKESDCLHGRKWTLPTLHSVVLHGGNVAPGPAVGQEACDGQGCSYMS